MKAIIFPAGCSRQIVNTKHLRDQDLGGNGWRSCRRVCMQGWRKNPCRPLSSSWVEADCRLPSCLTQRSRHAAAIVSTCALLHTQQDVQRSALGKTSKTTTPLLLFSKYFSSFISSSLRCPCMSLWMYCTCHFVVMLFLKTASVNLSSLCHDISSSVHWPPAHAFKDLITNCKTPSATKTKLN